MGSKKQSLVDLTGKRDKRLDNEGFSHPRPRQHEGYPPPGTDECSASFVDLPFQEPQQMTLTLVRLKRQVNETRRALIRPWGRVALAPIAVVLIMPCKH
jgi:hypothetical protein